MSRPGTAKSQKRPSYRLLSVLLALMGGVNDTAAIGLGSVLQNPVIGQPLRIEVPLLLAPGESMPAPDCVKLTPPTDAPDRQFYPRRARAVLNAGSKPRISIISPDPVAEPLLEFRLSIGCGNSFARDYIVLSDVPSATPTAPSSDNSINVVAPVATPALVENAPLATRDDARRVKSPRTPRLTPPTAAMPDAGAESQERLATDAANTLRISHDTTLNAMARVRYPTNIATRDEYRRLMAAANPELFSGSNRVGSVLIPAGTVLVIPSNLPPLESKSETKSPSKDDTQSSAKPVATKTVQAVLEPAPVAPQKSEATPSASKRQDRLVIGGEANATGAIARPLSPRELAAAIERMERMMEDQSRSELAITENLNTLNSAFIEVKNYIESLESRVRQAEEARRALETKIDNRPEPKSLGVMELLALILSLGAAGAGLILLHHRLTMQRLAMATAPSHSLVTTDSIGPIDPIDPTDPTDPTDPIAAIDPVESARPIDRPPEPAKPAPNVATKPTATKPTSTKPTAAVPPAPTFSPPPVKEDRPLVATPKEPSPTLPVIAEPSAAPVAPVLATVLDPVPTPDPTLATPIEFEFSLPKADTPVADPTPIASVSTIQFSQASDAEPKDGDAIELADIMTSMGLGKEAAKTLVEHILADPKRQISPWFKAFEIYRKTGQREEYEWLAENLRKHLNIQPDTWDEEGKDTRSLVNFRHLTKELVALWPTPECGDFLQKLLHDNRDGVREGFPRLVAEEIALLQGVLQHRLQLG
jgi:hypothetical protein